MSQELVRRSLGEAGSPVEFYLAMTDTTTLLNQLIAWGITHHTTDHPPMFTVEDGLDWHGRIPGLHCKSLFLKDKAGQLFLYVLPYDVRADLKILGKAVSVKDRLSFASAELLQQYLRVTPGAVTPFGLLFDQPPVIQVLLHPDLATAALVNFHPLRNDQTTTISGSDLLQFLQKTGHPPRFYP